MNEDLSRKKCVPCEGNIQKFSKSEINKYLKKVNSWTVNDQQEMIFKKFKFKNFKLSIEFANKIGIIAEEENHHPDITFGWGYCLIMIHTHACKGLTINDFVLASKIDSIG